MAFICFAFVLSLRVIVVIVKVFVLSGLEITQLCEYPFKFVAFSIYLVLLMRLENDQLLKKIIGLLIFRQMVVHKDKGTVVKRVVFISFLSS